MTKTAYGFGFIIAVACAIALMSSASWATTYYVSSSFGNDANNGLAPSTPWRSLGKVAASRYLPGDQILLKRGDIWRESFNPPSSGTSGSPVVFGGYDTGNKPSIRGSNTYNSVANWTQESGTLWYLSGIGKDPGVFAHDGKLGQRELQKAALNAQWDYWYDSANLRLYVYSTANPATLGTSLEVAVRQYLIGAQTADFITFDGLDLRHSYSIAWLGWGSTNVTFRNCNFTQSGGDHLLFHNGSNNGVVSNCSFDDWGGGSGQYYAVHTQGYGTVATGPVDVADSTFTASSPMGAGGLIQPAASEHTVMMQDTNSWLRNVQRNTIEGRNNINDDGIVIWDSSGTALSHLVEHNTIRNIGGMAIVIQQLENHGGRPVVTVRYNRIDNVSQTNTPDKSALRLRGFSAGSPVSVYYNTINKTKAGTNSNPGIDISGGSGAKLYNNSIYGVDNGITVRNGSTATVVMNNLVFGNRRYGIQADTSSSATSDYNCLNGNASGNYSGISGGSRDILATPLVISAAEGNFRLTSGSPCKDKGTYVGLTRDLDGNAVPNGTGTDIGAFEFSGLTIKPPVILNIQ